MLIINQFILGDPSEIHEVFSKTCTQSTSGVPEGITDFVMNGDVYAFLHSVIDRVLVLENKVKDQKRTVFRLSCDLKNANSTIDELSNQLQQYISETTQKITNLIAHKKTLDGKLRAFGEFDNDINEKRISAIESKLIPSFVTQEYYKR